VKIVKLLGVKPYDTIITIPNIITGLGLLLLIPYVWGFLTGQRWILGISLVLVGCSDLFDGMAARHFKQKTRLGEFLDPLRDRVLLLVVLINIVWLGNGLTKLWIAIITGIELAIVAVNCYGPAQGKKAEVHLVGKLRQAGHLLLVGLALLSYYFQDILEVIGLRFQFSFETALPIMAGLSFAALVAYTERRLAGKN